jgi:O-6-methylguanine DNA methyltransferase
MRELAYQIIESPVGELIIGGSEAGCCLVEYVDRGGSDTIRSRTERRYGGVMVETKSALLSFVQDELDRYFSGCLRRFSFPLDMKGSPFERSVWDALLAIPYGGTTTYGDIARTVGKPLATRAVGRANGANPLAIVVPCHRVIQSDGGMRGYGGGIWRKEALLNLESGGKELSFQAFKPHALHGQ